jgi:hypothetical protein
VREAAKFAGTLGPRASHKKIVGAIANELSATVAKAQGVPIENIVVNIALTDPAARRAASARARDDFASAGKCATNYLTTEERHARIKRGIHAALVASHTQYPAIAASPFESIRLPKGVILSYVRADGSVMTGNLDSEAGLVVTTANAEGEYCSAWPTSVRRASFKGLREDF